MEKLSVLTEEDAQKEVDFFLSLPRLSDQMLNNAFELIKACEEQGIEVIGLKDLKGRVL